MAQNRSRNNKSKTTTSSIYSTDASSKFISQSHENVQTELITITKDKLENILLKYLSNLNLRILWITPFSLFISFLIALLTSDFRKFCGLEKEVWFALFIILCIGSGITTLYFGIKAIIKHKDTSIESLLNVISSSEVDKNN